MFEGVLLGLGIGILVLAGIACAIYIVALAEGFKH